MPQRILFLILLFSSLHLTAQKSVIAATDTLTIRPKPPVLFKVNGKDGGLITESESMVWNFIYAGFGPGFTKDGIVFSVTGYEVNFYSLHNSYSVQRKSCIIDDSIKGIIRKLDGIFTIVFTNFKYKNNYDKDTLVSNSRVTFQCKKSDIATTILNEKEPESDRVEQDALTIYTYNGSRVNNKKNGLWLTFLNANSGIKIAETLFQMDVILEEREYYNTGILLMETKYNHAQSIASIKTYYTNGQLCYSGNYRVDNQHRAFLLNYNGSFNGDEIFYDNTTSKSNQDTYNKAFQHYTPQKALIGIWEFYYSNGKLAAKGKFDYHFEESDGHSSEGNTVTREAEWNYYHPDGELIHTVNYIRGQTMKEVFYSH